MTSPLNGNPPPRRNRSTRQAVLELECAIYREAQAQHPTSVRALFYRMVSPWGLVPKTDKADRATGTPSGYSMVQRRVLAMRRAGDLPYGWISDSTRLRLEAETWSGPQAALKYTAQAYRRQLWTNQDVYVEVWSEKDTVRGTIYPVTEEFDVPFLIARGQSSETFVYESAQAIEATGKPTAVVYQLGDHDKTGVAAWNSIQKRLRGFVSNEIELKFERLAVTPEQIGEYDLLTRPDKTDSGFGECVEVDAIEPNTLRGLVRNAIESHIDQEQLRITRIAEKDERQLLSRMAGVLAKRQSA